MSKTNEGKKLHDLIVQDRSRTKREFAELLGVHYSYLSRLEGVKKIRRSLAVRAKEVFNLPDGFFKLDESVDTGDDDKGTTTIQLLQGISEKLDDLIDLLKRK